ncbi:EAL domain-containing protein [Hydrogenimonas thermophila]|uniref:EAL domain-containing response regulator n=1 Tax=Hydrogenimonas thermophila TaxID=223786 RepID=UPI002936E7E9|nr:EAL domain-containing protein [Hydrogenimonas thermophila]WOE71188.1 EAL domain-containing protein [Hydrogenimonas thermophila]WOE73708.1 EAL domain-containing protein [Hydrogenimonas thermophila]
MQELKKELKDLTLLYVEDDVNTRIRIEKLFSHIFKSVTTAENGVDALKLYEEKEYDLVITDITMPKMNGIELIENIRNTNKNQTIIILTAHNTNENLLDAIDLQVDGFLLKPLDKDKMSELLYKIGKHIKNEKENISYKKNLESLVQEQQNKICELIAKDHLTGEYNYSKLKSLIIHNKSSTVCLLVINHLSELLDFFGTEIYEPIIKKCSDYLKSIIIEKMKYFHLRSNEFAIFIDNTNNSEDLMKKFCKKIEDFYININGAKIKIVFSTAVLKGDSTTLLKSIDDTLLKISQSGNIHNITNLNNDIIKQRWESLCIATNVADKSLSIPYYQPIFSQNEEHLMFEVLCRINNNFFKNENKRKCFFESCKKAQIFSKITLNVLKSSIKQIEKVNALFFINLCKNEILDSEFINTIINSPIKVKNNIVIEVNPSLLNENKIINIILKLKDIGIRICFDNVGLESFQIKRILDINLIPSFLKLDKSIISSIPFNERYLNTVQAYTIFAKNMNIKTIAVGIENQKCYEVAKKIGFDYYQGYYLAEPQETIKIGEI